MVFLFSFLEISSSFAFEKQGESCGAKYTLLHDASFKYNFVFGGFRTLLMCKTLTRKLNLSESVCCFDAYPPANSYWLELPYLVYSDREVKGVDKGAW